MAAGGVRDDVDRLVDANRQAGLTPVGDDGLSLWIVDLTRLPARVVGGADEVLDSAEIEAARRRPQPVRDRYLRRRLVRRVVLAAHTGIDAADLRFDTVCSRCGDPLHGKPSLVPAAAVGGAGTGGRRRGGIEFSTASSGATFVMGVSYGAVGVDVEMENFDQEAAGLLDRFATRSWPAVAAAAVPPVTGVRLWTGGEALSKGLGLGMWADADEMADAAAHWTLRWPGSGTGAVVCVATPSPAPPLTVRRLVDGSSLGVSCLRRTGSGGSPVRSSPGPTDSGQ